MTDADTIRQAAAELADDAPIATRAVRPFLLATAKFLDSCGQELAGAGGNYDLCDEPGSVRSALTIARAYLNA